MNNNDKTFVWISIEDFDIDKYYFDEIYDIDKKKIDPLEYEQKKVIYAIINERIKKTKRFLIICLINFIP